MRTRRGFISFMGGLAAALLAGPLHAQALGKPLVVYDDGLQNGWQSWSWAKVDLAFPISGAKPIKVQGDPWSALVLHHDAFSTAGYTKLTFTISGGGQGGQTLMVKATVDGKPVEAEFIIQPKAKTWTQVEVPLKDIAAEGKTIDGFMLQARENPYSAYYVTRVQFE